MKIAYISNPSFFDMDLSLTRELFKQADLHYFLDLPTYSRSSTALKFKTTLKKAGIYPAIIFDELKEFDEYIDLNRTSIIYRTSEKSYSASNLLLQYKLAKAIRKITPDIIHSNNFLNFNFSYFLATDNTPRVLTVHDPLPHSGETSKKDNAIRKFNYKLFNNIILLNKSQTNVFLTSSGKKTENVYFSRLGSYTYLKKYTPEKEFITNSQQLLIFGRVSPYKGIEELCKAFKLVISEFPNAKLIIAGSGEYNFDITPYDIHSNYIFINRYITNKELIQLIQESEFIVCPYKDATQSGVIMTSFALNKPVIATNVGGLKEMIINNYTGILIEPNNITTLADSIKWMFQNPATVKKMRNNIKDLNSKGNLSWSIIAKDLITVYSKLK
ncbi:glycosyltransferase family 4 protein [Algoriphagus sp. AGSA1]|uniref:glycosyltransferase family 4 protein n=1 Tax=Algoriphagus sp. AGSA1 TaxID=2907213 RepID=UPI001F23205D|nr:glycosyltransferase family 4 protein [Algoriphagus sp. AGSA1]MCE7053272.1 glycosyltransferase family 4 protein [Algoriphagus sp. AGSA1]